MPAHSTDDARIKLGKELADARAKAGVTQAALAALTLTSRSTVANVETGRQSVSREFFRRCDEHLASGGRLVVEYDRMRVARRVVQRRELASSGDQVTLCRTSSA